jgi:hypothetical protein
MNVVQAMNEESPDFSGCESLTDFALDLIADKLKQNESSSYKNALKFVDGIKFNGCKYLTIWALDYLCKSELKTIRNCQFDMRHRFVGCDRISESMIVSLMSKNTWNINDELGMVNTAKAVIIKDDKHQDFNLLSILMKQSSSKIDEEKSDIGRISGGIGGPLKYAKLQTDAKILNIFECNQVNYFKKCNEIKKSNEIKRF